MNAQPKEVVSIREVYPESLLSVATPTDAKTDVQKRSRSILSVFRGTFSEHQQFHEIVLRTSLGAGVGALLADLIGWALPSLGLFSVLPFTVASFALAAARFSGRRKWRDAGIAGVIGALGAGLFLLTANAWAPFSAVLFGASAALVLAQGTSRARIAATATMAAVFSVAGAIVTQTFLQHGLLDGIVPSPIATVLFGAAAGLFLGLSSAPRYLLRPRDPIELAYHETAASARGELAVLLPQAWTIHESIKKELEGEEHANYKEQTCERVKALTQQILHIAKRCESIEKGLCDNSLDELETRIQTMQQKALRTGDENVRRSYENARDALLEQKESMLRIETGIERVVARLHANVALLERVRWSLLHLKSAQTERAGGQVNPITDALEELGREVDATSTAMGEVFGGTPATIG